MSLAPEPSLKWVRPTVFSAWAVALAFLLAGRGYTNYLRPEYGFLLVSALIIAIGFVLAALTAKKEPEVDLWTSFRGLALLIPILYLIFPIRTTLDNSAFIKRFVGVTQLSTGPAGAKRITTPDVAEASWLQANKGNETDAFRGAPQELTILAIFSNPDRYRDQRVILTGMLLRDEKLRPFLGGRDTAVYRFLITCCAADAQPLAVAVESDQAAGLAKDQWVRVEGIFRIDQADGKSVPWLAAATLTPVEAPEIPYLY